MLVSLAAWLGILSGGILLAGSVVLPTKTLAGGRNAKTTVTCLMALLGLAFGLAGLLPHLTSGRQYVMLAFGAAFYLVGIGIALVRASKA